MINDSTNELFSHQVSLCNALNSLGDLLTQEAAKECYLKSFYLGSYSQDSHYWKEYVHHFLKIANKCRLNHFSRFAQLENTEHVLAPPLTVGFTHATYHAALKLAKLDPDNAHDWFQKVS